ncbi:MAG: hypothetical protein FGM52_06750 [Mycobacterium sp.]|nr:hypothetical protein [Mycobacterium sp.]
MSTLLANPTRINRVIARLAADQMIADSLYRPAASAVSGGGMLFDVLLAGGNFADRDVEQRSPGAEYMINIGELVTDLATPQDFGSRIELYDEHLDRYDPAVTASKIAQLANTLARKIDQVALAAIDAAHAKHGIPAVSGHDWDSLVTVGPLDSITPNSERPLADIATAALKVREDDLGVPPPDTLVCHPAQLTAMRIGYGAETSDVLASVGITSVRTSMQVPAGTAYVVSSGQAGILGFERPLTTEVIPERTRRSTWVQVYAVPAFAVPTPGAVRRITGLAGAGS